MEDVFPDGEYQKWPTCQTLLLHLLEAMQAGVEFDEDDELIMIRIGHRCGWYLFHQCKYKESEAMYRQALQ
jgi:hypothetical protein